MAEIQTPPPLLEPIYPISVHVVGAGGTGIEILRKLSQFHIALKNSGHPGIRVVVWDGDIIEEHNLCRQLYHRDEIGMMKSRALVKRYNEFFGFRWSFRDNVTPSSIINHGCIIIGCTDTIFSRRILLDIAKNRKSTIYIDCGNGKDYGQVLVQKGPKGVITDWLSQDLKEDVETPSCSIADSLGKQNVMINGWVAQIACQAFHDLFFGDYQCKDRYYIKTNPLRIA